MSEETPAGVYHLSQENALRIITLITPLCEGHSLCALICTSRDVRRIAEAYAASAKYGQILFLGALEERLDRSLFLEDLVGEGYAHPDPDRSEIAIELMEITLRKFCLKLFLIPRETWDKYPTARQVVRSWSAPQVAVALTQILPVINWGRDEDVAHYLRRVLSIPRLGRGIHHAYDHRFNAKEHYQKAEGEYAARIHAQNQRTIHSMMREASDD